MKRMRPARCASLKFTFGPVAERARDRENERSQVCWPLFTHRSLLIREIPSVFRCFTPFQFYSRDNMLYIVRPLSPLGQPSANSRRSRILDIICRGYKKIKRWSCTVDRYRERARRNGQKRSRRVRDGSGPCLRVVCRRNMADSIFAATRPQTGSTSPLTKQLTRSSIFCQR